MWLGCFAIALILIPVTLLTRHTLGSWLAPGAFYSGLWAVFIVAPLLFSPGYRYEIDAVVMLVVLALIFTAGSIVGHNVGARGLAQQAGVSDRIRLPGTMNLLISALVLTALGTGAVVLQVRELGLPIGTILTLQGLVQTGSEISALRYAGEPEGFLVRLLMVPLYAAPALGALYARQTRRTLVPLLSIVPSILFAAVAAVKAVVFFGVGIYLGFYFAHAVLLRQSCGNIRLKYVLMAVVGFAGVVAFSTGIHLIRYGMEDLGQIQMVFDRLRIYFTGYLSAFSVWFADAAALAPKTWGARTFAGIFDAVGLEVREPGLYTDFAEIDTGVMSNVFSYNRGLIEDYGVTGTLILTFSSGTGFGYVYRRAVAGSIIAALLLSSFYFVTIVSFVVHPFAYNVTLAAWILSCGLALVTSRRIQVARLAEAIAEPRRPWITRNARVADHIAGSGAGP